MSVGQMESPEVLQRERMRNGVVSTVEPGRLAQHDAHEGMQIPLSETLHFESVSVRQRDMLLLSHLTLTVPTGTTMAVMGRSGVGKTSLLRVISGLAKPAAGKIDRPTGRVPVVFQEPRLLPWRTTRQNVELVLPVEERYKALDWLERVGLGDAVEKYPLTLSGGMRQRASIARALACNSPLILVDEPFSHLDIVTANQLRGDLKRHLAETGRTCIWVTHDPAEAAIVAEQTLVMAGPPEGDWRFIRHSEFPDSAQLVAALATAIEQSGFDPRTKENS